MRKRRAADWVLLGATLTLLGAHPSVTALQMADGQVRAWLTAPQAGNRFAAAEVINFAAERNASALAWAAVAWACRGPLARGLALAAAAAGAAQAGVVADLMLAAKPGAASPWYTWSAYHAAAHQGWVPAAALLAFAGRWRDAPPPGSPDPPGAPRA